MLDSRPVAWEQLIIQDGRQFLEITSALHVDEARRLNAQCERCGGLLEFVRAEAGRRRPETCCCGACGRSYLLVIGACRGCTCTDCPAHLKGDACPLTDEEMAFVWEGRDCDVFLAEAVPA